MIKVFEQNHFGVNTCIVYDDTKQCILIDVAAQNNKERQTITDFISNNDLKPVRILITHPHIDHICGATWACETFGLKLEMHPDAEKMIKISQQSSENLLGFDCGNIADLKKGFINENEDICYGNTRLLALDTAGHCAGSLSFYNKEEGFVITGDALFYASIGRTDLPTGDYDLLVKNIKEKLFTLPAQTVVYPGHGTTTTIGFEADNNPFI
jgi:glyoxylase-like metal-dependent hydrolase (beta-lactamase superfamily II)